MRILLILLAGVVLLFLAAGLLTAVIVARIEARYPPQGQFVEVAGGRLHYREAGPRDAAATIVLLHGASGTSADPMLALGDRLAERHRVIAFDRPGHGWSDRLAGDAMASPARQATVLREALGRLGADRAVIVGHSWAGTLATNLALDHADLVSGLVLLSPVSHPWPGGEISWYYGPATATGLGWLFTRTLTTPLGWLLMDASLQAVFTPQEPPADYRERARLPLVLRPKVFQANAEDVAALYDFVSAQAPRYGAIRAPTSIVAGDVDRIVRTDIHARALGREIPGARLTVLPNVGHMPHHARPEVILGEIERLAGRAAVAAE